METDSRSKEKQRIVISTRSSTAGDVETARANNIRLVDCPAYYYRWISPSPLIRDAIVSATLPDAWVFTSRRGVEGWWRIWKELSGSQTIGPVDAGSTQQQERSVAEHSFHIPPVYVAGEKTRAAFNDTFSEKDVRMAEEQNGTALARRMVDDGIRSVVHFCSVDRRSELREICRKNRMNFTEVEVYRSCAVTDPEPVSGPVDAVLFFSPNGVSGFQRLYGLPEGGWNAVAVGPTTAEAVRRITGRNPQIAQTPSFGEMIKLV